MTVATNKVQNRRELHFNSVEEILADVERLAKGKVRTLGNWSAGQILKHLAIVMDASIDGAGFRLPWYMRLLGRMLRKRVLNGPMSAGFKLPTNAANVLVPPPTSFEEGLAAFRHAVHRQQTETSRQPSVFLGPLTAEEWTQLHCRHAELHLSFLALDETPGRKE
jgi:hypothetical protein